MSTSYKTIDYLPDLSSSQMASATAVPLIKIGDVTGWSYTKTPTLTDFASAVAALDGNPSDWVYEGVSSSNSDDDRTNGIFSFQGIKGVDV